MASNAVQHFAYCWAAVRTIEVDCMQIKGTLRSFCRPRRQYDLAEDSKIVAPGAVTALFTNRDFVA